MEFFEYLLNMTINAGKCISSRFKCFSTPVKVYLNYFNFKKKISASPQQVSGRGVRTQNEKLSMPAQGWANF